ncbi:hypothetical protein V8E36_002705 [Tilletia maclaganii]
MPATRSTTTTTTSTSTSKRGTALNAAAGKGKAKVTATAAAVDDDPGQRAARSLPYEIQLLILQHAAAAADSRPLSLLLLNKQVSQDLAPYIYRRISLSSYAALDSFSSLLLTHPHICKHVKALWIGPRALSSDLLRALAPDDVQLHHERSACTLVLRRTHNILRSCRNIQSLALSGKLISIDHAKSYGKACNPREVWAVNPYSFVTHYEAPILERTETFQLFDLTLAQEECSTIIKMPKLQHFVWTTPSFSSTSQFVSQQQRASSSSGGPRYHPPREAALLWRLLFLSNPFTHNRKTRPPLRTTFAAGPELVAEVEASLCPTRLPPIPTITAANSNSRGKAKGKAKEQHSHKLERRRKNVNDTIITDSVSMRASHGGHSTSTEESSSFDGDDDGAIRPGDISNDTAAGGTAGHDNSDDDEDEEGSVGTEDEDDEDEDEDEDEDVNSALAHTSFSQQSHTLVPPDLPLSATARAEALEASFRSLTFSTSGLDDPPPPLFLYQPTPSLSSAGHHSNGSSSNAGHQSYLGGHARAGGFEGAVITEMVQQHHGDHDPQQAGPGAGADGGAGSTDTNNGTEPDPDAALNILSYEVPQAGRHNHHNSLHSPPMIHNPRSTLTARAPSLSSLSSTVASTHGHSSHHHHSSSTTPRLSLPPANGAQQQQPYKPTLDDIDAPNRLRTRAVPRAMILEWEALRDRVCPVNPSPMSLYNPSTSTTASRTWYESASNSVSPNPAGWDALARGGGSSSGGVGTPADGFGDGGAEVGMQEEIDPGNALFRIWRLWIEATEP